MARKKAVEEDVKEQLQAPEHEKEEVMTADLVETALEDEAADIEPLERKDEGMVHFQEKLKALSAFAKKKKNVLEYQEIVDFFSDIELQPGSMNKIYDYLES